MASLACGCYGSGRENAAAGPSFLPGGKTLEELRTLYQTELENDPEFWNLCGVDHLQGGFLCSLDPTVNLVNDNKDMMLQGRGLWVHFYLYNNFGQNPEHPEIAGRTMEFLFRHVRDRKGSWHAVRSREGDALSPFKGSLYAGLYIAHGLHGFTETAGNEQARVESLRSIIQCMEHHAWNGFGGLAWSTQIEDGLVNCRKASYLLLEAMLGLLWIIKESGAEWAMDWFNRPRHNTFEKFRVEGHSRRYIYLDRQRYVPARVERQENCHPPRFLMPSLQTLDRMIPWFRETTARGRRMPVPGKRVSRS